MPGTTSPEGRCLNVGELVGINPRSPAVSPWAAPPRRRNRIAVAIATGWAQTVACIHADTAHRRLAHAAAAGGGDIACLGRLGRIRQCHNGAMGFRRHGVRLALGAPRLGRRDLLQACVDESTPCRTILTIDDHQNSRLIVDPCACSTAV
jgi:hypothetical protein